MFIYSTKQHTSFIRGAGPDFCMQLAIFIESKSPRAQEGSRREGKAGGTLCFGQSQDNQAVEGAPVSELLRQAQIERRFVLLPGRNGEFVKGVG